MTVRYKWAVIAILVGVLAGVLAAVSILTTDGGEGQTIASGRYPTALLVDPQAKRIFVSSANHYMGGNGGEVDVYDSRSGASLARIRVEGVPAVTALLPRTGQAIVQNQSTGALFTVGADGHLGRVDSLWAPAIDVTNSASAASALGDGVRIGSATFRIVGDRLQRIVQGQQPQIIALSVVPVTLLPDDSAHRVLVFGSKDAGLPEMFSGPGLCSVLDARTGRILHRTALGTGAWIPALDRKLHRAFVANGGSGTVTILDSRTGTVLRTVSVGTNPAAVAVDERRSRIFVAVLGTQICPNPYCSGSYWAGNGLVVALSTSGTHLRTWHPNGVPGAVAVDPTTGHVFVLDSGGEEQARPTWLPRWLAPLFPAPSKVTTGRVIMLTGG